MAEQHRVFEVIVDHLSRGPDVALACVYVSYGTGPIRPGGPGETESNPRLPWTSCSDQRRGGDSDHEGSGHIPVETLVDERLHVVQQAQAAVLVHHLGD